MSTTKNYKRHDKLFNENYSYRFNCQNKNTVYYICVVSGCTGRAAVYNDGSIKVTKQHDCTSSGNQLRKQKKNTAMLDKRLQTLVAQFSDMDLDDFLRGIANTMAHGSKKTTRPLESIHKIYTFIIHLTILWTFALYFWQLYFFLYIFPFRQMIIILL